MIILNYNFWDFFYKTKFIKVEDFIAPISWFMYQSKHKISSAVKFCGKQARLYDFYCEQINNSNYWFGWHFGEKRASEVLETEVYFQLTVAHIFVLGRAEDRLTRKKIELENATYSDILQVQSFLVLTAIINRRKQTSRSILYFGKNDLY